MYKRIGCVAVALAVVSITASAQHARATHISGVIVDSGGRPIESVEIAATAVGRLVRSDADGRFVLGGLLVGRNRLLVRQLGWRAIDTTITVDTLGTRDLRLVLTPVAEELEAIHIVSQDDCPIRTLEGFECRRRGGIGAYRDSAEIAALKPVCYADIVYGMDGLRQVPGMPCGGFTSITGWRCLITLVNGHRMDGADSLPWLMSDYIGVEFYANYADVPEWYKQDAYAPAQRGSATRAVRGRATQFRQPSQPGRSCALVVWWTRRAERFNPKLDHNKATTRAMQARRDSLMLARLDSLRAKSDSTSPRKPPR
jgi:hypothetical protein